MVARNSQQTAESYIDWLAAAGYKPHDMLAERDALSFKEQKTQYKLQLSRRCPTVSYQVDGNLIDEGYKCDFMVLAGHEDAPGPWTQVLVELKGTAVEHAITQLESSIKHPMLIHRDVAVRKARIVAQSFPSHKSNPVVEKARRRFQTLYKCELKTVKSNQPDKIF